MFIGGVLHCNIPLPNAVHPLHPRSDTPRSCRGHQILPHSWFQQDYWARCKNLHYFQNRFFLWNLHLQHTETLPLSMSFVQQVIAWLPTKRSKVTTKALTTKLPCRKWPPAFEWLGVTSFCCVDMHVDLYEYVYLHISVRCVHMK